MENILFDLHRHRFAKNLSNIAADSYRIVSFFRFAERGNFSTRKRVRNFVCRVDSVCKFSILKAHSDEFLCNTNELNITGRGTVISLEVTGDHRRPRSIFNRYYSVLLPYIVVSSVDQCDISILSSPFTTSKRYYLIVYFHQGVFNGGTSFFRVVLVTFFYKDTINSPTLIFLVRISLRFGNVPKFIQGKEMKIYVNVT